MPGRGTPVLAEFPPEFWAWAVCTLMLTAALGFAAGAHFGRHATDRLLRRARRHVSRLCGAVMSTLETAQQAVTLLQQARDVLLTAEQLQQLDAQQNRLLETLGGVIERQRSMRSGPAVDASPNSAAKTSSNAFSVDWVLQPEDETTNLPNHAALEANLANLLQAGREHGGDSGLLLVQLDKYDQLRLRFGVPRAQRLLRRLARVVLRSIREEDLLCHVEGPQLAVLMPGVDAEAGLRLAEAVRHTVRNYRFRLDESGPEVLVTASFGFTSCPVGDSVELALNRAAAAVIDAERRGRNQLHAVPAGVPALCATA